MCADDGYELWLKYRKIQNPTVLSEYRQSITSFYVHGQGPTCAVIKDEMQRGLDGLLSGRVLMAGNENSVSVVIGQPGESFLIGQAIPAAAIDTLQREGFLIRRIRSEKMERVIITAPSQIGLLYGVFSFLRHMQCSLPLSDLDITSNPKIQYRVLNHWDNLDGSVERGYAGRSLWRWDELPATADPRYTDYARANASIGINCTVLNNVNASPLILKTEYLEKVAALADIFRPYGIRVFLSVNMASPLSARFSLRRDGRGGIGDLQTADSMDPEVRRWWAEKVRQIYDLVPDFGGFLVKANSEGMPGPQDYNRSHADGANMLAEALAPYGGVVMWRAFVYDANVDADRAKRSYKEFVPLDGCFSPNVFVQAKNGPVDFQPREPVQPLFGAMPETPLLLELQITQEYLGHSTHLVYLAPMWKEYLSFDTCARGEGSTLAKIIDGSLHGYPMTGITGVSNIGDNRNWCGHIFAQANWYAFGRLAWDYTLTAEHIADEWIRMSLSRDEKVVATVKDMMLGSWEACVDYMTPLGLHHIMQEGFHYGPQPDLAKSRRKDWTSVYYHRADSSGLGFDRSSSGSGATSLYFSPLRERLDAIETCPEKYLLWFHHVPWDFPLRSRRTLWDELCYRYGTGPTFVRKMIESWNSLRDDVDEEIFLHVQQKLDRQEKDAHHWADTCLRYFQTYSKRAISLFE